MFSATSNSADQARPLPVLRHVRDAQVVARARRSRGDVLPEKRDAAAPHACLSPVSASTSSVCPLPCTPAMPTTSPSRTVKSTPSTAISSRSSRTREVAAPRAARRPGLAGVSSTPEAHRRARPSSRRARLRVAVFGSRSPTTLPRAQHADAVGDLQHFVQLVGDEHQRLARPRAATARCRRIRSTSCGVSTAVGSSKMMTLGRAEQHLDDLDALLQPDRNFLDHRVGIDRRGRARC